MCFGMQRPQIGDQSQLTPPGAQMIGSSSSAPQFYGASSVDGSNSSAAKQGMGSVGPVPGTFRLSNGTNFGVPGKSPMQSSVSQAFNRALKTTGRVFY
jgi:hypothetical protein